MIRANFLSPRRVVALLVAVTFLGASVGACGVGAGSDGNTVEISIGYQSKTINTVTAGTLMRGLGYFEQNLAALGRKNGKKYEVTWHDFASGPPLTAQMIAGKVDIGSMGDYPLSVNGAKTAAYPDAKTRWISTTGYNLLGSLNQVVVPSSSKAKTLRDLRGQVVSTSLGSTAHGNLVRALGNVGMSPQDVRLLGQDPAVGVTALESGQVAALAQFVPYPQEVVFSGKGRLLNGGDTGVPTFHGVVANNQFMTDHPEVIQAFLAAQWQATQYLYAHPMQAALTVAKATGLPPEVVYLYNGPNGVVTFDMTIKTQLVHAIEVGLPFLKDLGALKQLDLNAFVDEAPLRQLFGADYDKLKTSLTNPAAITGTDQVCHTTVNNPATASEAWPAGQDSTIVAATPTCLLNLVAKGGTYRALYVPDTKSGTRIFGRTATWVSDPKAAADADLLPFGTVADADAYVAAHPGATVLDYQTALASVH